jgi:uncharacterized OB-fold protein
MLDAKEKGTAPSVRRFLPPRVNPETADFWSAASEGRLLYGSCNACRRPHYYPRRICPFCFSETEWKTASGKGTIYTYSVMHRSATGPYAIAYVTLAEGPTILTNLVDCDLSRIEIGSAVTLIWKATEGEATPPLPFFTLV